MKKAFAIAMLLTLLIGIFCGCSNITTADYKTMQEQIEALKKEMANSKDAAMMKQLQEQIEALQEELANSNDAAMIRRLQAQITALQQELANSTDAAMIKQLQAQIAALQQELANSTDAAMIKQLQDQIVDLQKALDKATGLPTYGPNEVAEVRFNGRLYYTIKSYVEYHNGIVANPKLPGCETQSLHCCGFVEITNHALPPTPLDKTYMMKFNYSSDHIWVGIEGFRRDTSISPLKIGETRKIVFSLGHADPQLGAFYLDLSLPNFNYWPLAIVNVYDGKTAPIEGNKGI